MSNFFISLLFAFFMVLQLYGQSDTENERLYTLTKVYGVIKYYNNDKKDAELEKGLMNLLKNQDKYLNNDASFNNFIATILHPYILEKNRSGSGKSIDDLPFMPVKGTDCIVTLDFSWITSDPVLSKENKDHLNQMIALHKPVANSNIKKGNTAVHKELKGMIFEENNAGYTFMLIKYWNVINYFFVYKNLMDESWDTVLKEVIPS